MLQPSVVYCRILEHGKDLELPKYQSSGAAGADLRAALRDCATAGVEPVETASVCIKAGEYVKIPTALQIALPEAYEGQVRPRSGLAAKYGVTVLNSPGTIDSDYRGEICVLLVNHGKQDFVIKHGDRIAHLVIVPVVQAAFQPIEMLPKTERGASGFGSSGIQ